MKLLLIRHAPAELRETTAATGRDDGERPLTDRGRRRMRRTAKALPRVVPALDVLATSPLTRAAQTAAIVSKAYGDLKPIETAPSSPTGGPGSSRNGSPPSIRSTPSRPSATNRRSARRSRGSCRA